MYASLVVRKSSCQKVLKIVNDVLWTITSCPPTVTTTLSSHPTGSQSFARATLFHTLINSLISWLFSFEMYSLVQFYSGDLNKEYLNNEHLLVRYLNASLVFRPAFQYRSGIQMVVWILEKILVWNSNGICIMDHLATDNFEPFEYQTSSVFRSKLYTLN